MQVLVTGDMGFIGPKSVGALRQAGMQALATRPSPSPDEELAAPPAHTAHTAR